MEKITVHGFFDYEISEEEFRKVICSFLSRSEGACPIEAATIAADGERQWMSKEWQAT